MMHDGMATEMTYDIAEEVWGIGASGKKWEQTMDQSLSCELDAVIEEAYEAGKKIRGSTTHG